MNILKNIYIARFFLEDNKNYNFWTLYEHIGGNLQECGDFTGGCLTVRISGGYSYKDNKTNQEVLLPSSL